MTIMRERDRENIEGLFKYGISLTNLLNMIES